MKRAQGGLRQAEHDFAHARMILMGHVLPLTKPQKRL